MTSGHGWSFGSPKLQPESSRLDPFRGRTRFFRGAFAETRLYILWATPPAAGPLVDRHSEIRRSSLTSRSESPYIALSLHACILECLKSWSIMALF